MNTILSSISETGVRIRAIKDYEEMEREIQQFVDGLNAAGYSEEFKIDIIETVNKDELECSGKSIECAKNRQPQPYRMLEFRICDECGKIMAKGYTIGEGDYYYCSDKCLEANMTREEFEELYDDGEGQSYWTTWY